MRIDLFLVNNGLCRSRSTASESIKNGNVRVNGKTVSKPSFDVSGEESIEVFSENEKYVSRGGYKLEGALDEFKIDVASCVCADIGASTGGFTDCLLQRNAKSVLAIDSGSGQLVEKIAADPRVTSYENTNIRDFTPEKDNFCDFICVDVSFISLKLVFPAIDRLLKEDGSCVCLIKPQFEAGRENVGKGGIVKNRSVYKRIIADLKESASAHSLTLTRLTVSPIKGGDGNTEFLGLFERKGKEISLIDISDTVDNL